MIKRFLDILPTSIIAYVLGFLTAQIMSGNSDVSMFQFLWSGLRNDKWRILSIYG